MTYIHHLNGGVLQAAGGLRGVCHCLLLEDPAGLTLVDTGIGLEDVRDPLGRVGRAAIDAAGFQFDAGHTLLRQLQRLGLTAGDVEHIVLTHADPDHVGGLADFPHAVVHVAAEELAALTRGDERYRPKQFAHVVRWRAYGPTQASWFGLAARPVAVPGPGRVLLVELFGHTAGHCGVAVEKSGGRWLLHAGDAYYLRDELTNDRHPVAALAAARAVNDDLRRASLAHVQRLTHDFADEIEIMNYHDAAELPPGGLMAKNDVSQAGADGTAGPATSGQSNAVQSNAGRSNAGGTAAGNEPAGRTPAGRIP
ncbi:MAG: MBL fold metallo-hydrolase [Phycisphaerae bacterium]